MEVLGEVGGGFFLLFKFRICEEGTASSMFLTYGSYHKTFARHPLQNVCSTKDHIKGGGAGRTLIDVG